MKKITLLLLSLSFFTSCKNQAQETPVTLISNKEVMTKETIYSFKVKDLNGKEFDFASLKGKKIMIVNTASKCGLTPQYKDLEAIFEKYKEKNFVIVGFPANNFASQEPGTNKEIGEFCQRNYQ